RQGRLDKAQYVQTESHVEAFVKKHGKAMDDAFKAAFGLRLRLTVLSATSPADEYIANGGNPLNLEALQRFFPLSPSLEERKLFEEHRSGVQKVLEGMGRAIEATGEAERKYYPNLRYIDSVRQAYGLVAPAGAAAAAAAAAPETKGDVQL